MLLEFGVAHRLDRGSKVRNFKQRQVFQERHCRRFRIDRWLEADSQSSQIAELCERLTKRRGRCPIQFETSHALECSVVNQFDQLHHTRLSDLELFRTRISEVYFLE